MPPIFFYVNVYYCIISGDLSFRQHTKFRGFSNFCAESRNFRFFRGVAENFVFAQKITENGEFSLPS